MKLQTVIQSKLVDMISTYRNEFDKLTEEEKRYSNEFESLTEPCQFHVLVCEEYQMYLIIKTNFPELEDKLVNIVELPPEGFEETLEQFLEMPQWKKKRTTHYDDIIISQDDYEMMRSVLLEFAQNMRQKSYDKLTKITGFTGASYLPYWYLACNIEEVDLNQKAIQIIENYKRYAASSREKQEQLSPTITNFPKSAFASYFYPFVIIGEYKKSLKGQLSGTDFMALGNIEHDTIFAEIHLVVTKGGLIGVDTDNPLLANKIINTILGTALLVGFRFYPNRIPELGSAIVRDIGVFVNSWQNLSLRTMMYDNRMIFNRHEIFSQRLQIQTTDLDKVMTSAKKVWEKRQSDIVRLLLESYYFLDHQEFLQSFNASWLIIEKYLRTMWVNQLKSFQTRTKNDLRKIDLSTILRILKNENLLKEERYLELDKLRNVRNKVFHGEDPTEENALNCFNQSLQIVRNETKIEKSVEFEKLGSIRL